MAVDLVRANSNLSMTGGATWDVLATMPTAQAPNTSYMILDVIITGAYGTFAGEASIVARYQSIYAKDGSGNVTQVGTTRTMVEHSRISGGSVAWEYRQQISSNNITVEARGLVSGTFLYFDIQLRSK
jgi:hypothetical protein